MNCTLPAATLPRTRSSRPLRVCASDSSTARQSGSIPGTAARAACARADRRRGRTSRAPAGRSADAARPGVRAGRSASGRPRVPRRSKKMELAGRRTTTARAAPPVSMWIGGSASAGQFEGTGDRSRRPRGAGEYRDALDRRQEVVRARRESRGATGGNFAASRSAPGTARAALVVERRPVLPTAVLQELFAVVGEEDERRPVAQRPRRARPRSAR